MFTESKKPAVRGELLNLGTIEFNKRTNRNDGKKIPADAAKAPHNLRDKEILATLLKHERRTPPMG